MFAKRYKDDPKKECCYTCKFFVPEEEENDSVQYEGLPCEGPEDGLEHGEHGLCWAEGPRKYHKGTYETACCLDWKAREEEEKEHPCDRCPKNDRDSRDACFDHLVRIYTQEGAGTYELKDGNLSYLLDQTPVQSPPGPEAWVTVLH